MKQYLFVWMLLVSGPLLAESLPDPTRPPPGIGVSGSALEQDTQPAYPKVRGLQSVIISPSHCAVIIDGKTYEMGAMYGKERLVDISERGAVLQGSNGRRTLTLFPAVGIRQIEALPADTHASKCQIGQKRHAKNPANQAGMKEKK